MSHAANGRAQAWPTGEEHQQEQRRDAATSRVPMPSRSPRNGGTAATTSTVPRESTS